MKRIATILACLLLLSMTAIAQDDDKYDESAEAAPEYVKRAPETFYNMKKSHDFHIGLGYPNLAAAALKLADRAGFNNDGGSTPNFTLKYEYGITKDVGIGLHLGYYSAKTPSRENVESIIQNIDLTDFNSILCSTLQINCPDTTFSESRELVYDRVHATSVGFRFAYHRRVVDNIDIYGSTVIGYSFLRSKRIGDPDAEYSNPAKNLPTFIYFAGVGARYYITPKWGIYGELGYGALTVFNVGATYRILGPNT